jgi:hypothetical protein
VAQPVTLPRAPIIKQCNIKIKKTTLYCKIAVTYKDMTFQEFKCILLPNGGIEELLVEASRV